MKIITGKTGEPHVSSQQDADSNAALFGAGDYVLPIGKQLEYSMPSISEFVLYDGQVMMQGRKGAIDAGETNVLAIDSGTPGQRRSDVVAIRYEKDSETLFESMKVIVVKGAAGGDEPQLNTHTVIREWDIIHDMPLYCIRWDGVAIDGIDRLFTVWGRAGGMIRFTIPASSWSAAGYVTIENMLILPSDEQTIYPELPSDATMAQRLDYDRALIWVDSQATGRLTLRAHHTKPVSDVPVVCKLANFSVPYVTGTGAVSEIRSGTANSGG